MLGFHFVFSLVYFLEEELTLARLHRWMVPVMISNVRLGEQTCRCCRLRRIDKKGFKNIARITEESNWKKVRDPAGRAETS